MAVTARERPAESGVREVGLVGYCVDTGSNLLMDAFLRALSARVEAAGGHVLLFNAPAGAEGVGVYTDLAARRAVDAFVLADTVVDDPRHAALAGFGVPLVSFGRAPVGGWVDVDGGAATAELVRGLVALGHRRIGFLGSCTPRAAGVDERLAGWRRACADLGVSGEVVWAEEDTVAAGERAALRLLGSRRPPTAIVGVDDQVAIGALRAGRGEVAVTGFDDSPLAAVAELTSVRQPIDRIVGELVRLLTTGGEEHVLLRGEIVARASAPLAARQGRYGKPGYM
ncbi:substrate-binding domain-containing protein [Actinokineospora sp. UTMC 2448]|uniref:substrate-binding domain-containing protein n=1 Tax=Actinokineospora sp. UTMC 2448 TaxID=2268449 RepID=UPI002164031F|nr:substrate-binding domain-containing protein [Actinokineospora sp. UTMC 2448]UVS78187.1 Raffinose operon repressor [Actinokineospora sp. UTMC 2448]